ncbi:MAG: 4-oxalocrotonate tautomerase DmpI [Promethearchaeota archaeon]|jgi:4-oxalocrotonate tautomerase
MPIITVEGPKRDIETKRKLVKEFTTILKKIYGYPEDFEHMTVIIRENSPENVGANGELLIDRWKK